MKSSGIGRVLVTGGAGFIGSHVVDLLIDKGYETIVLDCLQEQVHGKLKKKPDYLNPSANFILDNLSNLDTIKNILPKVDAVIHLAATVGVGQSMYQIHRYIDSNTAGTALLLDSIVNTSNSIKKLIVASSMSNYGEGKYYCEKCSSTRYPTSRDVSKLKERKWEPECSICGSSLIHKPTDEQTPVAPTSIYAMSKWHQEQMVLLIGETYNIPSVALRFFNVYGPRQALSNPYTGACAIFSSRLINNKPPHIFEDGKQLRDFIHVKDVARSVVLALENNYVNNVPINIGSGNTISIIELAEKLSELYGVKIKPHVSNEFRKGDIRHCYADISRAKKMLSFQPEISLTQGLNDLIQWAKDHHWGADLFDTALTELKEKQLI
ncbi:MAG: NAD-dependent epimerase/dehydratase family protein [Candidatus Bathyarchaeia archaeon]